MKDSKIGEYPRWLYHPSKPPLKVHSEVDEATAKEYRRAPYPPVEAITEPTLEDQVRALELRVVALEGVMLTVYPPVETRGKKSKGGE